MRNRAFRRFQLEKRKKRAVEILKSQNTHWQWNNPYFLSGRISLRRCTIPRSENKRVIGIQATTPCRFTKSSKKFFLSHSERKESYISYLDLLEELEEIDLPIIHIKRIKSSKMTDPWDWC